jgi:hypothetical protein
MAPGPGRLSRMQGLSDTRSEHAAGVRHPGHSGGCSCCCTRLLDGQAATLIIMPLMVRRTLIEESIRRVRSRTIPCIW